MLYDLDTYHDLARPFFGVKLLTPREDFLGDVSILTHGTLTGFQVKFSNQRQDRNPARITEFDTEYVLLEIYTRGSSYGIVEGQRTLVTPGIVHMMDWSRHYMGVTTDAEGIGLHIPHADIGYDPSRHPAYVALSTDSSLGCLLAISLELLIKELQSGASTEVPTLTSSTLGLIRSGLLGERDWHRDPAQDRSRRALVESYVRRNLDSSDLGSERICRDLGMSRATLYRVFGSGGIEQFIRGERLEQCLSDLLCSSGERGAVRRAAERWGFDDAANFRRSFRARFGFSPSDCLRGASPAKAPRRDVHPIHRSLRERRLSKDVNDAP